MRRTVWSMCLVVVTPFVAGAPVPRDAQKPRIDYFPTQVGSKWVYKNTQNEDWERTDVVTSVEEKDGAKIIEVGTRTQRGVVEHRETMRLSPQGLFQINVNQKDLKSPACFLKFPIQVGQEWDCP